MTAGTQSVMARLAERLLFVAEPPHIPPPRVAGTNQYHLITVLLNGRHPHSDRALTATLLNRIGPALRSRHGDWNLEHIRILRCVRWSRPIVFFFELTRTHAVASWLCRIAGEPTPPPYSLTLCPQYEAIIELRFAEPPSPEAITALRDLIGSTTLFETAVLIGSQFQVQVYDDGSRSDIDRRVDICFLVRRPPGVTREACQTYWRENHATLALTNMRYLQLTRYRQVHTLATPPAGLDDTFDGVVYAEKRSFFQLLVDLLKPNTARFNSTVVVDECHFTDSTPVTLMQRIAEWRVDPSS